MKNKKAARRCAAALLISIVVALIVESSMLTAKISGILGWSWAPTLFCPAIIPVVVLIVDVIIYSVVVRPDGTDRSK